MTPLCLFSRTVAQNFEKSYLAKQSYLLPIKITKSIFDFRFSKNRPPPAYCIMYKGRAKKYQYLFINFPDRSFDSCDVKGEKKEVGKLEREKSEGVEIEMRKRETKDNVDME
jgi:hypothetical protein